MKANIVVIGAGIIGVSVAYHLAQLGVRDIVLVDKGDLDENDGSTSHAPGGVRVLTPSDFFTRLGSASAAFYKEVPLVSPDKPHYFETGTLQVASTEARFESYRRLQEMGLTLGINSSLLSPAEIAEKQPLLDPSKCVGGFWIPSAGVVKTSLVATSMRHMAEATGAVRSLAETEVTEIVAGGGRVRAVLTDNPAVPRIECEQVVICSNIWAPLLCEKLGVPMPLFPGQHQYIYTETVPALRDIAAVEVQLPMTAMDDISIYFRQHFDHIGIGSYHHKAMLVDPKALGKKAEFPFTPDDFTTAWSLMRDHMPALNKTEVSHGFNGMFSFTVDGFPVVGESHIKGLWTSVGAWLSFAGELGKELAHWMVDGEPTMDMRLADINRFHPFHSNREYLSRQSKYFYEIGFDIIHPSQVASSVRDLRLSPYHDQMRNLGAVLAPFAGTETALWYEANATLVAEYQEQIPLRSGWDAEFWSPIQGAEHLAMRAKVGLVDWSGGMGQIEVSGPGATKFLNQLGTADVDRRQGSIIYTLWLNNRGGIKRDLTVVRWAKERYWVLTGRSNLPAEMIWMQRHAPQDGTVTIRDLSDGHVGLALWGPQARNVLSSMTHNDVSDEAFPFYTAQAIDIGMVPAVALRISYAGELGWEIYAPANYGARLWDTMWAAGEPYGMIACGAAAVMSMRLEKGYRLYGADLDGESSPYEVGLDWLLDFRKESFVGREAVLGLRDRPVSRKLVCLTFEDPATVLYGFEPLLHDNKVVGRITSGNYGYSIGKFIAYAYVAPQHTKPGTKLSVRYTGRFYEATVSDEPLFDKRNSRLKS